MTSFSSLESTIKADLSAGVSWFDTEAADVGLALWNITKGVFIALEPAEAKILIDILTTVTTAANSGDTIEQIETAALNTAKGEQATVLQTAGSELVQMVIAGIKAAI